jgi:hypothetical protein
MAKRTLLTRKRGPAPTGKRGPAPTGKRGPAPSGKGELVGTRLQPPLLVGIDRAIAAEGDAPSRPEMIRRIVVRWLSRRGHVGVSDFQKSGSSKKAAAARRAAAEAIDRIQWRSSSSEKVKAHRKKKLITIAKDLTEPDR